MPKFRKLSKIMTVNKMNGPWVSSACLNPAYFKSEKITNNTLDPSSGGTGTKLKTIKKTFNNAKFNKNIINKLVFGSKVGTKTRKVISAIKAIIKFDNGPAMATIAGPYFGYFKLYGLNGTGLAQPNAAPLVTSMIRGIIIVPHISMCAIGFKVKRPAFLAVLSPSR